MKCDLCGKPIEFANSIETEEVSDSRLCHECYAKVISVAEETPAPAEDVDRRTPLKYLVVPAIVILFLIFPKHNRGDLFLTLAALFIAYGIYRNCGAAGSVQHTYRCHACGAGYDPSQLSCLTCGSRLIHASQSQTSETPYSLKQEPIGCLVFLGKAILALLGIAALLLLTLFIVCLASSL